MKTAKQILVKHSPVFDDLFADKAVRRWGDNIIMAMEEYSQQQSELKDKRISDLEGDNNKMSEEIKTMSYTQINQKLKIEDLEGDLLKAKEYIADLQNGYDH